MENVPTMKWLATILYHASSDTLQLKLEISNFALN